MSLSLRNACLSAGEQKRKRGSNAGGQHHAQCQHFFPLCKCAVGLDWIP
jgi:hypothetical protein